MGLLSCVRLCDGSYTSAGQKAQERLVAKLPQRLRDTLVPCVPYQVNHQLLFRSLVGGQEGRYICEQATRIWNAALEAGEVVVGDGQGAVRSVLEISPERRLLCKNYYSALEWVRSIASSDAFAQILPCNKSLKVFTTGHAILGETPRGKIDWCWSQREMLAIGLSCANIGEEHLFDKVPSQENASEPEGDHHM